MINITILATDRVQWDHVHLSTVSFLCSVSNLVFLLYTGPRSDIFFFFLSSDCFFNQFPSIFSLCLVLAQRSQKSQLYTGLLWSFSRSVVFDSWWPHGLQHASLPPSFTTSLSLLKLMSIESGVPSKYSGSIQQILFRSPLTLSPNSSKKWYQSDIAAG